MRILLITGGWSTEREVAFAGAQVMAQAITSLGHTVTIFDLLNFDALLETAAEHDLCLLNLHGTPGEDGLVQAMLDCAGIPYQGTGPAGSFLSLHKAATKQILKRHGILTPAWQYLPLRPKEGWQPKLPYPLFVKSDTGGSSIHLARVTNEHELNTILDEIFTARYGALVEEAIDGAEVTCGILGEEALPPILIEPVHGSYFDYASKYEENGAREICPAPLSEHVQKAIQETALKIHHILGLEGISRSDFILDSQERLYLLEVNTIPGMTAQSLVPKEAKAMGMDFAALMERFIALALKSHGK